jgi:hypothetical protein
MHRNAIDYEVLTGTERHKRILIPRINFTYLGTILPFNFQRSRFPIIAAFVMTINKSQKQTFEKIAILFRQPVFNCTSQQPAQYSNKKPKKLSKNALLFSNMV